MAMYQSKAMTARMWIPTWTKAITLNRASCISNLSDKKILNIIGVAMVEKHRSTKDKWLRKKYMVVWRQALTLMRTILSRFPVTMTIKMVKNSIN